MNAVIIEGVATCLAAYSFAGIVFAFYFIGWGARVADPGHERSGLAARLILLPGLIALWPVLVARMLTGARFKG